MTEHFVSFKLKCVVYFFNWKQFGLFVVLL